MNLDVRIRLSVMMFLQYAIWGLWGVTLATYLGGALHFSGSQIGWIYNTNMLALIAAPLFVGALTDKLFSIEKVLGVMHLLSAAVMLYIATLQTPEAYFGAMFLYSLLYFPTLGLTNAISFRNMSDPSQSFPGVRVLGTLGWIAAGLIVGHFLGQNERTLQASGYLSIVMGLYCFFLPHTPPLPKKEGDSRSVFAALSMLKEPSFAIFMAAAFVVSAATCFYYQQANPFLTQLQWPDESGPVGEKSASLQTIGQVSEIFFLLALPFIVQRIGVKWTLIVGMAGWGLRFWIFGSGLFWPIVLIGLPMHGICYDFFYVTSQLYVDKKARPELRASAQGLLYFITIGVGWLGGNLITGLVLDWNKSPAMDVQLSRYLLPTFLWDAAAAQTDNVSRMVDWAGFWRPAAVCCIIAAVIFTFLFWDRRKPTDAAATSVQP